MNWKEVNGTIVLLLYVLIITLKLVGVGEPATWSWWTVLFPIWTLGAVCTVLWIFLLGGLSLKWLMAPPRKKSYGQETDFVGLARHREFISGKVTTEEFRRASMEPVTTTMPTTKPQAPPARIWREGHGYLKNKD